MKKLLRLGILLAAIVCFSFTAEGQKYGYIDSNALIETMPAVKQMRPELEALSKQLNKKREQMYTTYKEKGEAAARKQAEGGLSPKEAEVVQGELAALEQEIVKYEQDMQTRLASKEQELLNPVLEKVQDAIKKVAKDNGYTMIFNAAVLLYADEMTDVSTLVKTELGM
ncbi:MAG: OmpH family outer membrane protein [Saprospiraceae bacterium]